MKKTSSSAAAFGEDAQLLSAKQKAEILNASFEPGMLLPGARERARLSMRLTPTKEDDFKASGQSSHAEDHRPEGDLNPECKEDELQLNRPNEASCLGDEAGSPLEHITLTRATSQRRGRSCRRTSTGMDAEEEPLPEQCEHLQQEENVLQQPPTLGPTHESLSEHPLKGGDGTQSMVSSVVQPVAPEPEQEQAPLVVSIKGFTVVPLPRQHVEYIIHVSHVGASPLTPLVAVAHRRFSEFLSLHAQIFKLLALPPDFPVRKRWIHPSSVLLKRSRALEAYLQAAIAACVSEEAPLLEFRAMAPPALLQFLNLGPR
mmetsp:Transcript_11955/g.20178  ORF Transcript_11955/g.20178 Transcript_11955/m.20178 type:complete len:316 (+) Transcript_11955:87-1034(+)|eukprot:CAMPEP_0119337156 /NCGR_PEP_ID=MMETSP1333-20130426/93381_1 /TAXON_ID=418940 /ORGANISM="Scyphosphaera apsteinii, Strain RCC1455" /LENGTH=315 /DNA_ID=CAMNT_0007348143 /DNA_START=81 /DNA_END=1028 /DNA_ORIENTATION=-